MADYHKRCEGCEYKNNGCAFHDLSAYIKNNACLLLPLQSDDLDNSDPLTLLNNRRLPSSYFPHRNNEKPMDYNRNDSQEIANNWKPDNN